MSLFRVRVNTVPRAMGVGASRRTEGWARRRSMSDPEEFADSTVLSILRCTGWFSTFGGPQTHSGPRGLGSKAMSDSEEGAPSRAEQLETLLQVPG